MLFRCYDYKESNAAQSNYKEQGSGEEHLRTTRNAELYLFDKVIAKRIEELLKDTHGECDIPDDLIKEIARCLAPNIVAFFETEEAKREFEEWKVDQEKKIAEKAKNEAMPK